MKRRPSRELSVFNLSMLDVICSALGAFVILFIISMQSQESEQDDVDDNDEDVDEYDLKQELEDSIARREEILGCISRVVETIAVCHTSAEKITLFAWDPGQIDDDRVEICFNGTVIEPSVISLPAPNEPFRAELPLEMGANVVVIRALNEGHIPPNTAALDFYPRCDGQTSVYGWRMDEGEYRILPIIRR